MPVRRPLRIPARAAYSVFVLVGGALVVAGVGLIFVPAALVLAGVGIGALGLVGLGARTVSK
jgi:hypothetical protein